MKVIAPIGFVIASMISIFLLVLPRVLYYFGLRLDALDAMLSAWFTFIVLLIVGGVLAYSWLKTIKYAVVTAIGIVVVATILTFYFCELTLPWQL